MTRSLPVENLKSFFKNKDVAETYLFNQVTFCEEMVQVHSSYHRLPTTEDFPIKIRVTSSIPLKFVGLCTHWSNTVNIYFGDIHFLEDLFCNLGI